jgi:hypothetical protein
VSAEWGLAMFVAKDAKQQRLIAAVSRERKKAIKRISERNTESIDTILRSKQADISALVSDIDHESLTFSAIRYFNIPHHFAFAYRKTGIIVTAENEELVSASDLQRWGAALLEYFEVERQAKAGAISNSRH